MAKAAGVSRASGPEVLRLRQIWVCFIAASRQVELERCPNQPERSRSFRDTPHPGDIARFRLCNCCVLVTELAGVCECLHVMAQQSEGCHG